MPKLNEYVMGFFISLFNNLFYKIIFTLIGLETLLWMLGFIIESVLDIPVLLGYLKNIYVVHKQLLLIIDHHRGSKIRIKQRFKSIKRKLLIRVLKQLIQPFTNKLPDFTKLKTDAFFGPLNLFSSLSEINLGETFISDFRFCGFSIILDEFDEEVG